MRAGRCDTSPKCQQNPVLSRRFRLVKILPAGVIRAGSVRDGLAKTVAYASGSAIVGRGKVQALAILPIAVDDAIGEDFQNGMSVGVRQATQLGECGLGKGLGLAARVNQGTRELKLRQKGFPLMVSRRRQQRADARGMVRRRVPQQMDQRQRQLLLLEVRSQRFADGLLGAYQIEQIVGDLKGNTERSTVAGEIFDGFRAGAGEKRAELARTRGQLRCLGVDDVEVLLFAEVKVAATTDLLQLPFTQTIGGFANDPASSRVIEGAGEMECVGEQEIAQKYAGLITPQ